MALTAATGSISDPLQRFRDMLSVVDEFQTWTSTTTAADALKHIHIAALPPSHGDIYSRQDLTEVRPFALVYAEPQEGNVFESYGKGGGCMSFKHSGFIGVEFEQDVEPNLMDKPAELDRQVQNTMGRLILRLSTDASSVNGILDLVETAGYLAINRLVSRGPWRSAISEDTDSVSWTFEMSWGWS